MEKSELIPIGDVSKVEALANKPGCKVGCLSSTYLELPLGVPFRSVIVWDGMEERLGMRKQQHISKGGRATLVKSTFSSLPIYFMSLFQMPREVRSRLDFIQKNFL